MLEAKVKQAGERFVCFEGTIQGFSYTFNEKESWSSEVREFLERYGLCLGIAEIQKFEFDVGLQI